MDKKNNKLSLKRTHLPRLFVYYSFLIIIGTSCSIGVFIPGKLSIFNHFSLAIIGSMSIACSGSAIFYFRKLYKLILQDDLALEEASVTPKVLGTLAYFVARPLFAIVFALLVVISIKSGLSLSSSNPAKVDYGFVQLTMFISFFVGFLSGRFIRRLEDWGDSVINRIHPETNDVE